MLAFSGATLLFILNYDMEYHEDYGLEKEYDLMGLPIIMGNLGQAYDSPGTDYFSAGLTGMIYGGRLIMRDQKLQQTAGMMVQSYANPCIWICSLHSITAYEFP